MTEKNPVCEKRYVLPVPRELSLQRDVIVTHLIATDNCRHKLGVSAIIGT